MKKLLTVITLFLLLTTSAAQAADTVTQSLQVHGNQAEWVLDVIDDSTNNVTATAMDSDYFAKLRGWYLYQVTTDPGTTAPDATYDIVLTVSGGTENLLGTDCDNRSATLTEKVTLSKIYCLDQILYFSTTGQTVDNATFQVRFVFVK